MNAGPDVERLIAGWLVEEAPGRAPDRVLESAGRVIDRTHQRRLGAGWREPMYVTMRGIMAAALVGVVAIGGAILFLNNKPSADVGASPTPGAVASTAPSSVAVRPIAIGTYRSAPIPVAGIMARLDASSLTPAEKNSVIHDILVIGGATTLTVEIRIDADTFISTYGVDGRWFPPGSPWRLYLLDATTVAFGDPAGRFGIQAWSVTHDGNSFTLHAESFATDPVENFVRSVLYETAAFSPVN